MNDKIKIISYIFGILLLTTIIFNLGSFYEYGKLKYGLGDYNRCSLVVWDGYKNDSTNSGFHIDSYEKPDRFDQYCFGFEYHCKQNPNCYLRFDGNGKTCDCYQGYN